MYMLYYSDSHLNMLQTIFYPFPFTLCRCSIPGSFMAKVVFCIALLAQNCHFWKWMGMWLLNVTHDLLTRHHATCLQCMQLHKTVFVIIYHIPIPLIPFLGSFPCVPTIIIHNLIFRFSCVRSSKVKFSRHILASLHFNENLRRETQTSSDGKEYIRVTYPKFKLGEEVVREVASPPSYGNYWPLWF